MSMGFYKVDCKKTISYLHSIVNPMSRLLSNAASRNVLPLDIVVDAGMSNIAQLAKMSPSEELDTSKFPNVSDLTWSLSDAEHDLTGWRAVVTKLD